MWLKTGIQLKHGVYLIILKYIKCNWHPEFVKSNSKLIVLLPVDHHSGWLRCDNVFHRNISNKFYNKCYSLGFSSFLFLRTELPVSTFVCLEDVGKWAQVAFSTLWLAFITKEMWQKYTRALISFVQSNHHRLRVWRDDHVCDAGDKDRKKTAHYEQPIINNSWRSPRGLSCQLRDLTCAIGITL